MKISQALDANLTAVSVAVHTACSTMVVQWSRSSSREVAFSSGRRLASDDDAPDERGCWSPPLGACASMHDAMHSKRRSTQCQTSEYAESNCWLSLWALSSSGMR